MRNACAGSGTDGARRDTRSRRSRSRSRCAGSTAKAIKADVERHLTAPDLAADGVASRHGISPRYLRSLFESEGASFGDFVATRRLALAHRMLSDPRNAGISIAMSAGFGDLSWFNVRFLRAYGMSPKDVRALAYLR